jgi:antirestriction protein ArdC
LSERSDRNDQWLILRVQVRARSGTAGELLDALAAEIRAIRLTGQWQTAEKFLFAHLDSFWRVLPHTLAEIAIAAAQANAIDDAMRLWRMSSTSIDEISIPWPN